MGKVLFSPLGRGRRIGQNSGGVARYEESNYRFEESGTEYTTSFITKALIDELAVDRVVFVGTAGSMWDEVYREFSDEVDEDYWYFLAEGIERGQEFAQKELAPLTTAVDRYLQTTFPEATGGSEVILFEYGIDETEIWRNFDRFFQVQETMLPGDEILIDITHSFRSIPFFMYLMIEYLQVLREGNVHLRGVYYGMFEAKQKLGYTPVVDLGPLFQLSQWIRATHSFLHYGNGTGLAQLIDEPKISKKVQGMTDLIQINYLVELRQQIRSLKATLKNVDSQAQKPLQYLLPSIYAFLEELDPSEGDAVFQWRISKWYFSHHHYAKGYICLYESILSFLCELYDLEIHPKENRALMKHLLVRASRQTFIKENDLPAEFMDFSEFTDAINATRNRIAHAAMIEGSGAYRTEIDQIDHRLTRLKSWLEDEVFAEVPSKFTLDELKQDFRSWGKRI